MSLRSPLTRLAIATAAGALAAGVLAAPATAADEGSVGDTRHEDTRSEDTRSGEGQYEEGREDESRDHESRGHYRGRVTASTLLLRSEPHRGSRVIRSVHRGHIVSIYCKTSGERIDGNRLWYLLTDGTWAWGSARYIDNIGAAPRWC
ncbi:SH3 domain-containing protein [Streptomyces sp. NPDC088789]|uniref:SH3 domain-containing protein n=1 Tax=Streptomyces sp. NPDC088789 TaxID=3365899 RepID=UPI0037F3518F